MQELEIRRPDSDDIPKLHTFFQTVVIDTFRQEGISHLTEDLEDEIRSKQRYLALDLQSQGEERYFLIAALGDDIVGTIELGPVSELILGCAEGAYQGMVEVGTVFVHPNCQGQGIGTQLLKEIGCILQARGIEQFALDSGYGRAQSIWRKKFGEPEYWLKDYWGEGADHMIWRVRTADLD